MTYSNFPGFSDFVAERDRIGIIKFYDLLRNGEIQVYQFQWKTDEFSIIPPENWLRHSYSDVLHRAGTLFLRIINTDPAEYEAFQLLIKDRTVRKDDEPAPRTKQELAGGRPGYSNWDKVLIEAAVYLFKSGTASRTGSAVYGHLHDIFGDDCPGLTQLKARVGPLVRALKAADSDTS